jgi:pimeloyl-ACP methyl ester carboxylesterase
VLVESGHEEQWERLPPPLTEVTRAAVPELRAYAQMLRRGAEVPAQPIDARFTDTAQRRLLEAFALEPGQYEVLANVIESMDSTVAMMRKSQRLGDLPLLVITADRSFDAFRHLPIDVAASNEVWAALQRELLHLSTCAKQTRSPSGDHNIQLTDPEAVVRGIARLRKALRSANSHGCPLTGALR